MNPLISLMGNLEVKPDFCTARRPFVASELHKRPSCSAKVRFNHKCFDIERKLQADKEAYIAAKESLEQAERRLKEHGPSELFKDSAKKLEDECKSLRGSENASQEEMEAYGDLLERKEKLETACIEADGDIRVLESFPKPSIVEPFYNVTSCYDALSDEAEQSLRAELEVMNVWLSRRWEGLIEKIVKERQVGEVQAS